MKTYFVTWEIDVDADSPREAAQKAFDIQRDAQSMATVFDVREMDQHGDAVRVDLMEDEEGETS